VQESESLNQAPPVEIPIDGVLDLHTFRPRDIKDVVLAYLAACQAQGIVEVRIIHGRGIGELRRTVYALLQKHPEVISFAPASEAYGGWGATIAKLRPPRGPDTPSSANR